MKHVFFVLMIFVHMQASVVEAEISSDGYEKVLSWAGKYKKTNGMIKRAFEDGKISDREFSEIKNKIKQFEEDEKRDALKVELFDKLDSVE